MKDFQYIQRVVTSFWQKISSVFFPPICLHCEEEMQNNRSLFCKGCGELLTLCDLPKEGSHCGWLFENMGPAKTLYSCFKRGSQVVFSKTLASYIVVQMNRMGYPMPDALLKPSKQSSCMRDLVRELAILLGKKIVSHPKKGGNYLFISSEMSEKLVQYQKEKNEDSEIYGMGIFPEKR